MLLPSWPLSAWSRPACESLLLGLALPHCCLRILRCVQGRAASQQLQLQQEQRRSGQRQRLRTLPVRISKMPH